MRCTGRAVRRLASVVVGAAAVAILVACGGGESQPVATVLTVDGMHCDGCEAAISEALTGLDGVLEVEANHEQGRVTAVHLPGVAPLDVLTATVEELGYTVAASRTEPVGT